MVGGLVEQERLGRGRQQACQRQPRALAAGQRGDRAVAGQVGQAEAVQGLVDPRVGLVAAACLIGGDQVAVLAEPVRGEVALELAHPALHVPQLGECGVDDLPQGVAGRRVMALAEVADASWGGDGHVPVVGRFGAGGEAQEGRLAGSVLSDDRGVLAGAYGQGDPVKNRPVARRTW